MRLAASLGRGGSALKEVLVEIQTVVDLPDDGDEHHPTRHDIAEFIRYSPAIPSGQRESFLRALLAGFDSDMLLVAHLVPPKFESMLRHVMEGMGADTSILGPTGLQPERIAAACR